MVQFLRKVIQVADESNLPVEIETNVECPSCGKNLFLIFYNTEIAYEERITIQTYFCKSCLYKNSTVLKEGADRPQRTELKVSRPEDLRIIIYRAPEASILIPEIEAEIFPGEASQGEITTVEGLIYRMREKIDIMEKDPEDMKTWNAVRKKLDDMLDGKLSDFTVVLEDPTGKSVINSSKAVVVDLKEK